MGIINKQHGKERAKYVSHTLIRLSVADFHHLGVEEGLVEN